MTKTALLIIDVQKGLDDPRWGKRNNQQAEEHIASLLAAWRKYQLPVIHVRHCSTETGSPLRPELPGSAYKEEALPWPEEKQFSKSVNSAFIGTGLDAYLNENDISSLVIVGLTTDHCVSTTVRMAANLGFDVVLVADATAAFERIGYDGVRYSAEAIHNINVVSLHGEFCRVRTSKDVLESFRVAVGK